MTDEEENQEVVIYDACVLYPYTLRDTLISLTRVRQFQARWTAAIMDEWTRNLLKNVPNINPERLIRTCALMSQAVPDALIEGHEHLTDKLILPDPDDRHVLAAAIFAGAGKIVTENTNHFPHEVVSTWGIAVCRPDAFVVGLLKDHPIEVLRELKKQRLRLINPPQSVEDFLESLRRAGLVVTADGLGEHLTKL